MSNTSFTCKIALITALLAGFPFAAAMGQEAPAQPAQQVEGAQALSDAVRNSQAAVSSLQKGGDVDRDFATILIAQRQGLIDLARAEFKYGKNAKLREVASEIIKLENREINRLVDWQRKNPAK
jgi:uncharacterized protein (DUF305 family)